MKKLVILTIVFLLMSKLNAVSTDEYNRDVYGHDRDGGHTVSRHVNKSFSSLRSRCKGVKSRRAYTSYRNDSDATLTLRNMISHPVNRNRINAFKEQRGIGRVRSRLEPTEIVREYSTVFGTEGIGVGIDCLRLGERIKRRKWFFWTYYQNLDEYNYLRTATASLGYNHTKKRWYIQTSFPVLKRK